MIDIKALEAKERVMSPAPWRVYDVDGDYAPDDGYSVVSRGFVDADDEPVNKGDDGYELFEPWDAVGIVEMRNALPDLLAEVKRLRERVAELEANAAGYPTVAEHEAAMERARLSMQAAPDPNRMAAWRDTGKGYRA